MTTTSSDKNRPRVIILGAGFAGIGAAQKLKKAPVDIVLIDKNNYHTFQPLLFTVASDAIDPSIVGHPIRSIFNDQTNLKFHQTLVTDIDLANKQVKLRDIPPQDYDYLVLALGAGVNYFGVSGAKKNAYPLYTLRDALRLKYHLLNCYESAYNQPDLVQDGALNVVIVGGGPTGVESSGAMADLLNNVFAKDYVDLPVQEASITLVDSSGLLKMFKPGLQTYTKSALEKRGVTVRLGEHVSAIDATRLTLQSGEVLKAHTTIWCAGVQAHPLVQTLGVKLERGNRVPIGPDLTLKGHPDVFVIGDLAVISDGKTGEALPQLGSVAIQAGERVGDNIARILKDKEPKPFTYKDKGTMATIGRGAAVVQMPRGPSMKGRKAWLAWGGVHIALLTGRKSQARAISDWMSGMVNHQRSSRIDLNVEE